jgi:hypothetical protein
VLAALIRSEFSRRHSPPYRTDAYLDQGFSGGADKALPFLCQLGCRRAAPVVVIRDHSMFLGARWWIFRALRPTIIHCVQNIVGNESTRDHFAKLPLPSTKFGKTLAFNAKIRLV